MHTKKPFFNSKHSFKAKLCATSLAMATALGLQYLALSSSASAADYNWTGRNEGTTAATWSRAQSSYRTEAYGGVDPGVNGALADDNLTIITAASLQLQNSTGSLGGGLDREINNLSATAPGANIASGGGTGVFTSLTVYGDLGLSVADATLTVWNSSASSHLGAGMTLSVEGNVNVAENTALYLGVIRDTGTPTSISNYLNGFAANNTAPGTGQINVDGKLMLNRLTVDASFGDFNIGSTGVVTLTGAAAADTFDGTFDKTIQARSLNGTGTLENSNVIFNSDPTTSSTAILQLNTQASTDADFGGLLRDGSGTNASLALEVNGAGIQALSGANTYSGGTIVNGGTLLVNNSTGSATGSGPVTIGSGGTLGGSGSISGPVSVAGTLAAGNSIGTMSFGDTVTLEDGATILFEFLNNSEAGVSYDLLVGPELDLTGASNLTLVITGLDGHTIAMDDSFTLFDGTVTGFSASQFTLINDSDWTGGWQLSESSLVLTAIPEPSAAVFVLLAAAGLYTLRRRRARS